MLSEIDRVLSELEAATDEVIQVIVDNNTAELETKIITQVQWMKKLSAFTPENVDEKRLWVVKTKVEQQQTLIQQALEVTNLYLQVLSEMQNFNRLG